MSTDEYLMWLMETNEQHFENIVNTISFNKKEYNTYIKQVEEIKSEVTEEFCQSFNFSLSKFIRYEDMLFKNNVLPEPQTNVFVHCTLTYSSPQGRNHYSKQYSYCYTEIKDLFDQTMDLIAKRETRQYIIKLERAKMTDSLRYSILKRDNFSCQICGSNAQDGVKLHVDHIIPVSKGGETIESNLRTLCDRCNLGKSDKL